MIEKEGFFKKEKKMRDRERIRNYGDEKEILEGDFYKPDSPASPFFRSESSKMKIQNKTGKKIYSIPIFGKCSISKQKPF